jgi:hypothetical protein
MKSPTLVRWQAPSRQSWNTAGLLAVLSLVAVLCGMAIALFPLQLSVLVTGFFLFLLSLAVAAVAPPMQRVPAQTLAWGLAIALAFYFIWPRNVFLPVRGLPVKHPQRLFYLLLLAYAAYVLLKCAPARQQLARSLAAVPWVTGLWVAFAVWQFFALLASKSPLGLMGNWAVETLVVTLLYPLVLLCCPTLKDFQRLFWALLVAALFNAALTLPETWLRRNLFEGFISLDALDPQMAQQIIAAKLRGGQFRAQAAFDHPLLLAEFLVVNLPFAFLLCAQRGRRLLGTLAVGLLFVGLYFSHSRVAVVASLLAISAMVVALILRGARQGARNPWPLVAALFAVPLAAAGAVVVTEVITTVTSGVTYVEASSTQARWQMFYGGLRLIEKEPLLGYGPGTAGFVLNFQNTFGVMTLDNYLLAVTLDFGVPALFIYLALLSVAGFVALRHATSSESTTGRKLAFVCFGALMAFGPIKLVLGTALNNLMLPVWLACIAAIVCHGPAGGASNKHAFANGTR